jgi:muramoyltetrapeptide carboxypeptidase
MQIPKSLVKGDTIAIATTARFVIDDEIAAAIKTIEKQGFKFLLSDTVYAQNNQFGGTDQQRVSGLQDLLDNPKVNATWFARGGYGTVRIIDQLNFDTFSQDPKWLIGFSDLTVLLNHVQQKIEIASLHAPMAMQADSKNALYRAQDIQSIFDIITGKQISYNLEPNVLNVPGNCNGILVGGNLSVLYSLVGTSSFPDMNGKILFLEDLDEYLYHIDRMIVNLKRNGVFDNLAGLIIGGMTDMNDNTIPFGNTAEEIILAHTQSYTYPKYFGFNAGHCVPNLPLIIGSQVKIENNTLFLKASY